MLMLCLCLCLCLCASENWPFNGHWRPVDRPTPSSRPTAVSDHFLSDNHSSDGMELIPLELIHSSRDALREAREACLVERGQTLKPKGINKREEI